MNNWAEEQTEQKFQDDYLVEKVRKLEAAIREIAGEEEQKFSVEELSAYLDMDEEESGQIECNGQSGTSNMVV